MHCWLAGPDDAPGWWPAVLVQWRCHDRTWVGQVAHVVQSEDPPVLVVAWVAAEQLRPA
jgi:hypothetical protein